MSTEILKKPSPLNILAYIRYSDLFPKIKPNLLELQRRLSSFDFFETTLILSKINLVISDIINSFDSSLQIHLSKGFLNEYTLARFLKKFNPVSVLFHRHQVLFMLKNSFLVRQDHLKMPFRNRALRDKLGTCFLITNDLLSLLELNEEEFVRYEKDKKIDFIWKESLPGWEINNPIELMLVISRMRILFREILSDVKDCDSYLDLNDIFLTVTKLTINEFMFFVFGFLSIYRENRKDMLKNPDAIYINKDRLLDKAKKEFPKEKLERFFDLVSLPLGQYQKEILTAKDINYNYGFLPFRKKPIADVNQHAYFCLDFYFLLEKIATGIFWTINDSLESDKREKFHVFWGLLFENYINKIIKESLGSDSSKFYSRPCYQNSADEISDGILLLEENLVLFEYKFTILSQEAKFEGSVNSLIEEIILKFEKNNKGEWKGYGQLANNINKLFSKSGQFACEQIDRKKIKSIFPVLIVYDDVLQTPFTNYIFNRSFQGLLNRALLMDNIEIYPLVVMTIEDFEKSLSFLENYSELLKERLQFDPSLYFSFSHFLNIKFTKEKIRVPEFLHSEYHKFSDEIRAYFFNNKHTKEP